MRHAQLFVHHSTPALTEVKSYFSSRGAPEQEAVAFYFVYECRQWRAKKGHFIKNWKTTALRWMQYAFAAPLQSA
jgi:hypothetical protein